jgi:hypothetical protein
MIFVIGADAATANAASEMQGDRYGQIVADDKGVLAQLKTGDKTLNIVAHLDGGAIGGMSAQQLATFLLQTLQIYRGKHAVSTINLHACYSDTFMDNLANALAAPLNVLDSNMYITLTASRGLNALNPDGESVVVTRGALNEDEGEEYRQFQALIKNGKISAERYGAVVAPHLDADGWATRTVGGGFVF